MPVGLVPDLDTVMTASSRPTETGQKALPVPLAHAVAPGNISKPVSIMHLVAGRSGVSNAFSTAVRPIRNRLDRTVERG